MLFSKQRFQISPTVSKMQTLRAHRELGTALVHPFSDGYGKRKMENNFLKDFLSPQMTELNKIDGAYVRNHSYLSLHGHACLCLLACHVRAVY